MHIAKRSLFILFVITASTVIVGCGSSVPVVKPFKMDIQQGNVVTSKMLLQLRPGMTKSQVKFIMGTPLINDSFHTNRWDYFYQMRRAGKVIEQRRVILDFENELLARVRGDVVPQGTPGAETGVTLSSEPSAIKKPVAKEGLLENLKFWKSNQEPEVEPAAKPADVKPAPLKPVETKPTPKAAETHAPESKSLVEPEASVVAPAAENEPPSMLAVPIEIAPQEPVPAPAPAPKVVPAPVVAPTPKAPVVEPVKQPAIVVPAPVKPEPVKQVPAPIKQDETSTLRLDKDINANGLKNTETAPAQPIAQPKAVEEIAVPAEDPGYFERMLEKIGF